MNFKKISRGDYMKKRSILLVAVFILTALFVCQLNVNAAEEVFHGGDIVYTEPLKAVLFSHKGHVEDLGLSCEMCHDGIFQMESLAAQKKSDFTMKSLYEGKYCGTCHNGSMAFASDTQCARCHIGVKGYNRLQAIKSGGN